MLRERHVRHAGHVPVPRQRRRARGAVEGPGESRCTRSGYRLSAHPRCHRVPQELCFAVGKEVRDVPFVLR